MDSRYRHSFTARVFHPIRSEAIYRKNATLLHRKTWRYIPRTEDMKILPFKSIFCAKQLKRDGLEFRYKARCVLRGVKQESYVDFEQEKFHTPVAIQESLRAHY